VTVGLLVILEGLLSADNALVVAVMILGLPRRQQKLALRYGLVGAFAFRIIATLLAVYLIKLAWVKLLGGLYLVYLTYQHFFQSGDAEQRSKPRPAKPWLGLPALWATILKVELVNIAFSVDSILVAVAISSKTWVVLTGGLLGIVAMRVVISQLLSIVRRYPTLVDGAFVIIALVGVKLLIEYAAAMGWIHFEVPKWLSLGLIGITFLIAYLQARRKGAVELDDDSDDEAAALLEK
jgi:YkoY family integral membrane protein